MLSRVRILGVALESVVGTAETLDATDCALNVFDAKIQPQIEMSDREAQSSLSPIPAIRAGLLGQASFRTEWHGSGTVEIGGGESVPLWAELLLPPCGIVASAGNKDVYKPTSGMPGADDYSARTVTIGCFIGGVLRHLAGCMGTGIVNFTAGKQAFIEWTFTGIWQVPTTTELPTPTYPVIIPPIVSGMGLTLTEDANPKFSEMTLDFGNEIVMREDGAGGSAGGSGYYSAAIVGRMMKLALDLEGVVAAHTSLHAAWLAGTEQALAWTLGPGAAVGNDVAFAAPKAQIRNIQEGDRNSLFTCEIEMQLNRSAALGEDELTITFS